MGKRIASKIKKLLSPAASGGLSPKSRDDVDVREEYADAFRTESYNQFWTRVTQLNHKDSATCTPTESTASARLMSYRLFTESLLDPDQVTVTRVIELVSIQRSVRTLLANYFSETANASFLCSILLRDINRVRFKYESLRTVIESLESPKILSEINSETLINQLLKLSRSINPFVLSSSSISRIQIIRSNCSNLLNRLESSKDKTRAKFKLISWLKHGSGALIIALTISLLVIIASHAFALLIAAPSLLTARSGPAGLTKRLMRASAQLDVAAKGTYILSRDLDMISRLVSRLNDELEHIRAMAKFWAERGSDRIRAGEEVARQLKRSDESFVEQLDELEEHLYLCFMTINRARNLVVKEILDLDRTGCPLGRKFK